MIIKQKRCKTTFAIFATLFATLTLIVTVTPLKVGASGYEDYTSFFLYGDTSCQITYREHELDQDFVVSMPFARLNTSQVYGSSYVVYYSDNTTSIEYLSPPYELGRLYHAIELDSYNFFIPQDCIHDLFSDSEMILGEYLGQSIILTIELDYLTDGLTFGHFENSKTFTGSDTECYLNDLLGPINKYAFKTFLYMDTSFVQILRMSIKVEQAYFEGSGQALWDLNLYMFDYSDYGNYADYKDAQRVLARRNVELYTEDFSLFDSFLATINDVLQLEILPHFRILDILALAITIPLTVWLLKAWLGG